MITHAKINFLIESAERAVAQMKDTDDYLNMSESHRRAADSLERAVKEFKGSPLK